jgi:hypothetical protein
VKIGARGTKSSDGKEFPVWSFYGKETGIVGLRLFPNPAAHAEKLLKVVFELKRALKSLPKDATDEQAAAVFKAFVPDLLSVSKCPDFIVNKGHYFGSNLADDDKNALIEFLKTF